MRFGFSRHRQDLRRQFYEQPLNLGDIRRDKRVLDKQGPDYAVLALVLAL